MTLLWQHLCSMHGADEDTKHSSALRHSESMEHSMTTSRQDHCCHDAQANMPVNHQHPVMLADKGTRMLAQRNPAGALNAFTDALRLEPGLVPALAGRAACNLQLGCFECVHESCTAPQYSDAGACCIFVNAGYALSVCKADGDH